MNHYIVRVDIHQFRLPFQKRMSIFYILLNVKPRSQLNHDLRRMSSKHQKQSKKTNSIPHGLEKMIVDLTANGIEPTDLVDILSDDDITLLLPPWQQQQLWIPPPSWRGRWCLSSHLGIVTLTQISPTSYWLRWPARDPATYILLQTCLISPIPPTSVVYRRASGSLCLWSPKYLRVQ